MSTFQIFQVIPISSLKNFISKFFIGYFFQLIRNFVEVIGPIVIQGLILKWFLNFTSFFFYICHTLHWKSVKYIPYLLCCCLLLFDSCLTLLGWPEMILKYSNFSPAISCFSHLYDFRRGYIQSTLKFNVLPELKWY